MGQFSWMSQDTNEQIFNDAPAGFQTVHMVDPRDGTDYVETDYEGYGRFGGMDFYALIVDINKDFILKQYADTGYLDDDNMKILNKPLKEWTKEDQDEIRHTGISLWFKYFEPEHDCIYGYGETDKTAKEKRKKYNLLSPILVMDYNSWRIYASPEYYPESDPDQGWGYGLEMDEHEEDEVNF